MIVGIFFLTCIISTIIGFILGYNRCYRYAHKKIRAQEQLLLNAQTRAKNWQSILSAYKTSRSLRTFLEVNDMHKVAIYGYGFVGKYIEEELLQEGIKVSFAVDQSVKKTRTIPVYAPTEQHPEYDVMIVTSGDVEEVRRLVGGTVNTVVELESILNVV